MSTIGGLYVPDGSPSDITGLDTEFPSELYVAQSGAVPSVLVHPVTV